MTTSSHPANAVLPAARTGGQILIDALAAHGVDTIFCVAGESYLAALDALIDHPEIKVVTCRQEGGAAFMAEAYGKITGKPGICFVTRGPGACNASIGVHTAKQDSTPMILLIGQVARDQMGREAFQEVDYDKMFGSVAKWTTQINKAEDVSAQIAKAFEQAISGRMGPAVVALPEDMLTETTTHQTSYTPKATPKTALQTALETMGEAEITPFIAALEMAERPLIVIGGSGYDDATCKAFEDWAGAMDIPVAASFRRHDLFDHRHPCYVGELGTGPNAKLVAAVKQADLVVSLGGRMGEITSQGYTLLSIPEPTQAFVHIHADAAELGKVYTADLAIHASGKDFITALTQSPAVQHPKMKPQAAQWRAQLRALYEQWTEITPDSRYRFDMNVVFKAMRAALPDNAIITTDAGNFSGWAQRYLRYGRSRAGGRLLAPTSGAMGYGLPSMVAAALYCPDRHCVALMGDGGFMMSGQELATVKALKLGGIAIVFDNGMYGTIRMHQEREYPKRKIATDLANPDFAALAQSYGLNGVSIHHHDEFAAAFARALSSPHFTLLHLKTDPRQITTQKAMDEL